MTEFKNHDPLNFSIESDRKKMEMAIKQVASELGSIFRLKDGKKISGTAHALLKSLNPAQPEIVVGSVESASLSQAKIAVEEMKKGQGAWAQTPWHKRIELTDRLADWMAERRAYLAAWMCFEVGKSWAEADGDVCEAIDFCRYYAREANRISEPRLTQEVLGEKNYLSYHPRGVGLVIAPWNFPLAILTGMTMATLVTGNTCIIKPAEPSGVIAALFTQGLSEVGFPSDSFYFLPGVGEEIGPFLVSHPSVDLITFTGSADVGLQIIESAAKKPQENQKGVKKVIAEMGGKNALLIDEDADLDEAVMGAIQSAFGFQGQKCSALSRLLIHEKIYDQFVERFVEATKSLKIGNPLNPENHLGPVIDEIAQARILATIEEAGARLKTLYQENDFPKKGYFVPPAIFEVSDKNDPLFQNEVFGPVVAVMKVSSIEEGVDLINSVKFALTAGFYSRSPSHIEWMKERIEAGNIYINRSITGAIVQRQPFGGFKLSGVGSKAGGPDYLLQFVEPRTWTENTVRRGFAGD